MRLCNAGAVAFLTGRNSLLDATLRQFCVTAFEGDARIALVFAMRRDADVAELTLSLASVRSFEFYHCDDHVFYNVERVKCLWLEDELFLSLDPYDESGLPSQKDRDVFRARELLLTTLGEPVG